jgi:hypothetical protein
LRNPKVRIFLFKLIFRYMIKYKQNCLIFF